MHDNNVTSEVTVPCERLPDVWRNRADLLRQYGADPQAQLCEFLAKELEQSLARGTDKLLSLQGAAEFSGFSPSHLRRLVREGKLRSVRVGRTKLLFAAHDLPRKPFVSAVSDAVSMASYRTQVGRAVAGGN
jgi:excisionase family DNA binding protein